MALDTSMLEELSLDELRWLEASEILEFPASPTHSLVFNDSVVRHFSNCRQWSEPRTKQSGRSSKTLERLRYNASSQPISTSFQDSSSPSARTQTEGSAPPPWTSSLPTPPTTPTRTVPSTSAPRMILTESPTQPWLHRQPRSITPKGSPSSSVLSTSLPIKPQLSSTSSRSGLSRTPSTASTVATPTATSMKGGLLSAALGLDDEGERKLTTSRTPKDPFWTTLRPRSRSLRSVPTLKTIPSQCEVNHRPPSCIVEEDAIDDREPSSSFKVKAELSLPGRRKGNSGIDARADSTSSSTSSTSSQSEAPSTPSDPYSAFLRSAEAQTKSFYQSRQMYKSGSNRPFTNLNPPLSSSCPSKSILSRTPSHAPAKDSPIDSIVPSTATTTTTPKSVKFAAMPTVHTTASRATKETHREPKKPATEVAPVMDKINSQTGLYEDLPCMPPPPPSRPARQVSRRGRSRRPSAPALDPETPTLSESEGEAELGVDGGVLKRFMPFARRPSVSSSPRPTSRTSSQSSALGTNPVPVPSPRPSISGPYPLGSFVPSSPTHSTSSLRSNMSKSSRKSTTLRKPSTTAVKSPGPRTFFSFTSTSTTPTSGITHSHGTGTSSLDDYKKNGGEATMSVRSLASVKSSGSQSASTGLKSWLSKFGR